MVQRTNQRDYVNVYRGGHGVCNSYVGRQGGEQKMSLGNSCASVGVVIHEFGHAIGNYKTEL